MGTESDIFDHSTRRGVFASYMKKFKDYWGLIVTVNIFILAFMIWAVLRASEPEVTPVTVTTSLGAGADIPGGETFNPTTGEYLFDGFPGSIVFRGITPNLTSKTSVKSFKVVNAIVEAAAVSSALDGMTNVQKVTIEARRVIGNYSRVVLPSLREFSYSLRQNISGDLFKPPEVLKTLLFFDKIQGQNWNLTQDVLNLGVDITVYVYSTVIMATNRTAGVINLDVPYCEELLAHSKTPYSNLIMSWCPFPNVTIIPFPGLKYLSLSNSIPTPADFSLMQKQSTQLQEFHAYQPYLGFDEGSPTYYVTPDDPELQTAVDISAFSPTLKTFTLCRLGLTTSSITATAITDMALQESNVTTAVTDNFNSLFPNLQNLGVYNATGFAKLHAVQGDPGLAILQQAVNNPQLKTLVVSEFDWNWASVEFNEGANGGNSGQMESIGQVLQQAGLTTNDRNFRLSRNLNGNWVANSLTESEIMFLRYSQFRFDDVYKTDFLPSGASMPSAKITGVNILLMVLLYWLM